MSPASDDKIKVAFSTENLLSISWGMNFQFQRTILQFVMPGFEASVIPVLVL